MTHPEFRKFRIEWEVYREIRYPETLQIPVQLYIICDRSVQNSIVITCDNILRKEEDKIINMLENTCCEKDIEPCYSPMTFRNINQLENEAVCDYVIQLNLSAKDCELECPNCNHDLSLTYVERSVHRGSHQQYTKTDILVK